MIELYGNDLKFGITDEATIVALQVKCTVIALMFDSEGISYRINYWWDGDRKCEWVFHWEIE